MSSNTFGKIFSFTTFGESHVEDLCVVIDERHAMIEVDY